MSNPIDTGAKTKEFLAKQACGTHSVSPDSRKGPLQRIVEEMLIGNKNLTIAGTYATLVGAGIALGPVAAVGAVVLGVPLAGALDTLATKLKAEREAANAPKSCGGCAGKKPAVPAPAAPKP